MNGEQSFSSSLIEKMKVKHIDVDLTYDRMEKINRGLYDHVETVVAKEIPPIDGKDIVEITEKSTVEFDIQAAQKNFSEFSVEITLEDYGEVIGDKISFTHEQLKILGADLAPIVAYGFLNGGSASSYLDLKKNKKAYGPLLEIYKPYFDKIAKKAQGKAKGITPAYINPDKSLGEDFFALKIRGILLKSLKYMRKHGVSDAKNLYRIFQMDSVLNSEQIKKTLLEYEKSDLLKNLIRETHYSLDQIYTASQPLLAAFTTKRPVEVFQDAYGRGDLLPMPGGHGQNFYVLQNIYRRLFQEGKRFAYLCNIDNMGNTVNDVCVAYLALSGKQAAFEFSLKTPADVKGGIVVRDQNNRLNSGDIGVALKMEEVKQAELAGKKVLFNTATGLFDLKYLVPNLEKIIDELPVRLSIQEKDAGSYMQSEQITWEIIGMLDDPLIFVVDKYKRFLASKMLAEGLMGSFLEMENPRFPKDLRGIAESLSRGMKEKLENDYGMELRKGRWEPKPLEDI